MRARGKKGHEIAVRKEKEWKSRQEEQSESEEREISKLNNQMLLAEQDWSLSGQRKNLQTLKGYEVVSEKAGWKDPRERNSWTTSRQNLDKHNPSN
jgi:hypothetical protein